MITLFLRYTFNANKLPDFKAYVDAEFAPIRRCGGQILGYFLPTDFAGPTNEACGLIDFESLAAYETYRAALADDAEHQTNVARLEQSNALVSITRSMIRRAG
jgi:hypothetical protein